MTVTDTSIKSYKEILATLGERQQLVYDGIKTLGCPTDMELAGYLKLDARSVGPRRNELVSKGLVVASDKRDCLVTGKTAISWRAIVEKI